MADEDIKKPSVWTKKAKKYRLTGRQHKGFSEDGSKVVDYETGDEVMLEPHQFEGFKDKFEEIVSKVEKVVADLKPDPKEAEKQDPPKTAPTTAAATTTTAATTQK
jgi:hypothetical protein